MRTRSVTAALVLCVIVLLPACASSGGSSSSSRHDLITRDEIESVRASSLYEVVQRLRPRWLDVRGGDRSFETATGVVVFQGQTLLGGTAELRNLSPDMAGSLRYLDGPTASNSLPGLGSRHVAGAIIINTASE